MRSLTICMLFSRRSTISAHPGREPVWLKTWNHLEPQLGEGDEAILVDCNADTEFCAGRTIPFESERIRLKVLVAPKEARNALNFLRNPGIKEVKHDPIFLLDPGCIPGPELLENARVLFDPGVVYGAHVEFIEEHGGLLEDQRQNWESDVRKNQLVDEQPDETSYLTGYCLQFNKELLSKLGWFTKDIDGHSECGVQDYQSKGYHDGVRLIYEPLQYKTLLRLSRRASTQSKDDITRNQPLKESGDLTYSQDLPTLTPTKPEIFILVVTMLRPYFLDECIKRIFQSMMPVKVRIVNQGDRSERMLNTLKEWTSRRTVDYVFNEYPRSMAEIRSEAFSWAKEKGYDFAVTVDDDMLLMPGALDELVKMGKTNPQFHAIAGYCVEPGRVRLLGGKEKVINGSRYRFNLPYSKGLTEVDYVSSGLRIVRLDPLILQDTEYDFGWIDWDYSKRVKQAGLKLAVTGRVGGYHGMMQIDGKWRARPDPEAYTKIRLDEDRMEMMTQLFEGKWGTKVAREKPPLIHRILFRAQRELGTISYRSACFYEWFIHRK